MDCGTVIFHRRDRKSYPHPHPHPHNTIRFGHRTKGAKVTGQKCKQRISFALSHYRNTRVGGASLHARKPASTKQCYGVGLKENVLGKGFSTMDRVNEECWVRQRRPGQRGGARGGWGVQACLMSAVYALFMACASPHFCWNLSFIGISAWFRLATSIESRNVITLN